MDNNCRPNTILTDISVIHFSPNSPVNLISFRKVFLSPQSVASKYLFHIVDWSLVPCFSAAYANMEASKPPALRFQWRHSVRRLLADGLTSPASACWHLATTKSSSPHPTEVPGTRPELCAIPGPQPISWTPQHEMKWCIYQTKNSNNIRYV